MGVVRNLGTTTSVGAELWGVIRDLTLAMREWMQGRYSRD